jgi:hypothetical protein
VAGRPGRSRRLGSHHRRRTAARLDAEPGGWARGHGRERATAAPGRKFTPAITFREFALASVFSFAAVFAVAEAFGILLVVGVAALTLGVRLLVHRWAGAVSWRFLLACVEGIEVFVLLLCALL